MNVAHRKEKNKKNERTQMYTNLYSFRFLTNRYAADATRYLRGPAKDTRGKEGKVIFHLRYVQIQFPIPDNEGEERVGVSKSNRAFESRIAFGGLAGLRRYEKVSSGIRMCIVCTISL